MSSPVEADFYCPSCASPAFDETIYCTGCGADVRYVQHAMQGGLTIRQRKFIGALSMIMVSVSPALSALGSVVLAGGAAPVFDAVFGAITGTILAGSVGYAGYMLARDGSSQDPLFRRLRPAAKQLRGATPARRR
jgi:hypothetical protein